MVRSPQGGDDHEDCGAKYRDRNGAAALEKPNHRFNSSAGRIDETPGGKAIPNWIRHANMVSLEEHQDTSFAEYASIPSADLRHSRRQRFVF